MNQPLNTVESCFLLNMETGALSDEANHVPLIPAHVSLFHYYQSLATANGPPGRFDLKAVELGEVLQSMFLCEVDIAQKAEPNAHRYFYYGSTLTRVFGYELNGSTLAEISNPDRRQFSLRANLLAMKLNAPMVARGHMRTEGMEKYYSEALVLPLRPCKSGVFLLFGSFHFERRDN